jgi:hypothetical protein
MTGRYIWSHDYLQETSGNSGHATKFTGEWSLGNAGPWGWTSQDHTNFLRFIVFHLPRVDEWFCSLEHRVHIFTRDETGLVCLPTQLERTLQVIVMKGGGRAPPTLTSLG